MIASGAVFFAVFVLYLVYALVTNWRRGEEPQLKSTPLGFALQAPLFLLACHYGWQHGVFTRAWFDPLFLIAGIALGHAAFALSCWITRFAPGGGAPRRVTLRGLARHAAGNPEPLFRFLGVSVSEELIYRAAAQPLLIEGLGHPLSGIAVAAAAFSLVHWHFFRNPVLQSAEFLAFSLLLGALYHGTGSILLVVLVHTVRNLEIAMLEDQMEHEDTGGSALPMAAPAAGRASARGELA